MIYGKASLGQNLDIFLESLFAILKFDTWPILTGVLWTSLDRIYICIHFQVYSAMLSLDQHHQWKSICFSLVLVSASRCNHNVSFILPKFGISWFWNLKASKFSCSTIFWIMSMFIPSEKADYVLKFMQIAHSSDMKRSEKFKKVSP